MSLIRDSVAGHGTSSGTARGSARSSEVRPARARQAKYAALTRQHSSREADVLAPLDIGGPLRPQVGQVREKGLPFPRQERRGSK